jgi:hypothetical protein
MYGRRPDSTREIDPRRRRAGAVAAVAGIAALTVTVAGCSTSADAAPQAVNGSTPYTYQGQVVQTYSVPAGVTSLTITAIGGSGGQSKGSPSGRPKGAQVTGTLAVQPGQELLISVAGEGADASTSDSDPAGGWGGLGAVGGNGDSANDYLRTSGAGGGATTIQLANSDGSDAQTVLVAGGGGGFGGGSGDPLSVGYGGDAGCSPDGAAWWPGSNGGDGSSIAGGKGGKAAAETGMAGGRGGGGSGLGGNGGGGGGGVNGGGPGTGARLSSAAGGGGAGSSTTTGMTGASVACASSTGNGSVSITAS